MRKFIKITNRIANKRVQLESQCNGLEKRREKLGNQKALDHLISEFDQVNYFLSEIVNKKLYKRSKFKSSASGSWITDLEISAQNSNLSMPDWRSANST